MKDMKKEVCNIWESIESSIKSLYDDIYSKLEADSSNEMLNKLNRICEMTGCSTGRIQGIIEGRLFSKDEILNLSEIDEIIEINESIKYYLNEKISEFRNNIISEEDEEAVHYLVLYRSIIFSLQVNCISLKRELAAL